MSMQIPDHLLARTINLTFNVAQAARVPWLQWQRSILGSFSSYRYPPVGYETELAAFDGTPVSYGTLARALFSVPIANRWLRQASGPIEHPGGLAKQFPRERWFFINGICSDRRIAAVNAEMLCRMFRRPLTILYNATDGFLLDLVECAAGKGFEATTEAAARNLHPLVAALCDATVERVVLVAHSQGTIVASALLKALQELLEQKEKLPPRVRSGPGAQKLSPERRVARKIAGSAGVREQPEAAKPAAEQARAELTRSDIGKLEIYCFANCSTSLAPIAVVGDSPRHAPWLESYGNEYDLVAKLGVLAPPHGIGSARIEGERYRRGEAWGHLLNAHYLVPIVRHLDGDGALRLTALGENLRPRPRLYEYYRGSTPAQPYP